ncbi:MAG: glycosyltransferase [Gemmatimonadaceae bacterium]
MDDGPKVSVTVVTFNHEAFIGPCLESIVSQQTDFDFEVIVGEDASTDGTRAMVEAYARKYPTIVRPVYQPVNRGVNNNLATVLSEARGAYIAHIDGDDLALPGKLQRQVDLLDARPDVALCFHNLGVFESTTGASLGLFTPRTAPQLTNLNDLVRYGTVYGNSSKMFRRDSRRGMAVDPNTRHVMDWLLHIQSAVNGRIAYIDDVLGKWRRHSGATTTADRDRDRAMTHFDELLYTVGEARKLGASEDAAAFAESRINYAMALRQLNWGDVKNFRRLIEASVAGGVRVNRRHHDFAYRYRKWPRIVGAATRLRQSLES